MTRSLRLTQDPDSDVLLSKDPLALLVGMLLDQQVPMEKAFAGPKVLVERFGQLDAQHIAATDPDEFAQKCSTSPAIHRYPGSMAKRIQRLCQYVADSYDGQAERIWTDQRSDGGQPSGSDVLKRLKALPGYGEQKAQIFLALLGKQWGVQPEGWREAAGSYGDESARRSIADVVDQQTLEEVRSFKKEQKAAAKATKGS